MSSAEPPPRHRAHPAAYVLAVLVPLLLLAALAAPLGIAWATGRQRAAGAPPAAEPAPGPLLPAIDGAPGVGDPYFPDYGSGGYDALGYDVDLTFDPDTASLRGRAVVRARAARDLESFFVDLALPVSAVRVDGVDAAFELRGFQDVRIEPAAPVAAGSEFRVEVTYAGRPGEVRRDEVTPWSADGQEWTVAGEPESSAWWYPANDHPSDPATLDVSVRVPAGLEVVSTGALASRDAVPADGPFATWRWVTAQPAVTYATFLSIGQFDLREGTADGRPYVYAVSQQLEPAERERAFAVLARTPGVVRRLEAVFGAYPFSEVGGVVPVHEFGFGGLETQTRPVYEREAILDADGAERLLVHEIAHMWFGDRVTLARWDDIFLNEGYASWAEWIDSERTGGRSADEILERAYDRTAGSPGFWRVTMDDPGEDNLFDTVYVRGPMVLQALRNVLGEEAFAGLTRDWAARSGPQSVEGWMELAQSRTTTDLDPFFDAWISGRTAPARTRANGFP